MPFEALNARLNAAALRRDALLRAQARFSTLETDVAAARRQLDQFSLALRKEKRDFERLEGQSIQSLFYSVLGNREKQLEKERQEYLAALLKFDAAAARIEALEADRARILAEAAGWEGADSEYESLLREKEALLLAAGTDSARRLGELTDRQRALARELREVEEAERAGGPALASLKDVQHYLRKAANWGTWDLFGGDMLATWAKHDNMNDARAALHQAQHALLSFRNELADLGRRVDGELDLGGLTTFADYFFDNLITDWIVQQRINRSLEATGALTDRVRQLLLDLGQRKARLDAEVDRLEQERFALISAG